MAEATDGGLNCFVRASVKVSGLKGPACWSSTARKEVGCPLGCYCLWLLLGSAEQFGWTDLLASESLGCLRCIPFQLVLVPVVVEMSVAQMLRVAFELRESVCCCGCSG